MRLRQIAHRRRQSAPLGIWVISRLWWLQLRTAQPHAERKQFAGAGAARAVSSSLLQVQRAVLRRARQHDKLRTDFQIYLKAAAELSACPARLQKTLHTASLR